MKFVLQEKPVSTDHPKLGKVEFKVEVGEVQSIDEMVSDCGGAENAVAFYNGQRATNAKNTARAYARNYEVAEGVELTDETKAALIKQVSEKGQSLAKDYSPATDTERGPSKAKKAQAFDQIAALVGSGKEFTKEELFALLNQAK